MKNVFIAAITAGTLALAVGCESRTDTGTTGASGTNSQSANTKKTNSADGLGNSQADDAAQQQQQQQVQTQTPAATDTTQQQQTTQTPTNTTSTPTTQDKYKNYVPPTEAQKQQMAAQGYAQVYNGTREGLVSANGQTLPQVIPPGQTLYAPRSYDFDASDSTTLTVTTDGGHTASGTFVAGDVAEGNWKAQVMSSDGVWTIKQNAGGGGGGGGGTSTGAGFK